MVYLFQIFAIFIREDFQILKFLNINGSESPHKPSLHPVRISSLSFSLYQIEINSCLFIIEGTGL